MRRWSETWAGAGAVRGRRAGDTDRPPATDRCAHGVPDQHAGLKHQHLDDTHAEAIVHPSGPVMGAVLAVAERQPVAGAELLAAFTLGVEVVCRLSKAVSVAPAKGNIAWSQTGISCGVGAALAASRLLGLDGRLRTARRRHRRLAGLRHPRRARHHVHGDDAGAGRPDGLSRRLSRGGRLHQLRGRPSSTATALPPALPRRPSRLPDRWLGEHFEILGNTYKPFPCGIVINPLIDAALQLRAEHQLERRRSRASTCRPARRARAVRPAASEGRVRGAGEPLSLGGGRAGARPRRCAGGPGCRHRGIPALAAFRERITATPTPSIADRWRAT